MRVFLRFGDETSLSVTDPATRTVYVSSPGAPGADGTDGIGVPIGGTTGQVLAKATGTDYDTQWVDQTGGGGGAVDSVFGRTGAVVAANGDYTPAQVGAIPASAAGTDLDLVQRAFTSGGQPVYGGISRADLAASQPFLDVAEDAADAAVAAHVGATDPHGDRAYAAGLVSATGRVDNTLYVDAAYGDDGTGARERADLPYATLGAAKTAAQSGDLIVVRPGSFAQTELSKPGVSYWFGPGSRVEADSNLTVWDFAAAGTYRVYGYGRFHNENGHVFDANPLTDILLEAESISVGSSTDTEAVAVDAGPNTAIIRGATITAPGASIATVRVGSGSLTLDRCRVIAPDGGAPAISGDGEVTLKDCEIVGVPFGTLVGLTVKIIGTLTVDTDPDPTVPITGGVLVRSDTGAVTAVGALTATNFSGTSSGTNTGDVANTALTTGTLAQFAATTSAQLRGVLSDETGTGAAVFATSPTLVTPALGTPSAGNLSGCTADGTNAVGYRGIPQNSQSAAYTTVLADAGKHLYHPSADTSARTWTIDSNANVAYPLGTAITFVNDTSAGVITIAITSDTLVLAGAGSTGVRTLAANGVATAIKVTSTRWVVSGTGLT